MKKIHVRIRRPAKEPVTLTISIPLKTPLMNAMIQTNKSALLMLSSVIMFEYLIVNLIATSLSKVTNIRWRYEAVCNTITDT